jgi:dTDP-4-amino-4,6-dideoxygalactose transaminase
LQAALAEAGVQTNIHYPVPVHLLPAWAELGLVRGAFPNAEAAADEVLSLPMFPELTLQQLEQVTTALAQALQRAGAAHV